MSFQPMGCALLIECTLCALRCLILAVQYVIKERPPEKNDGSVHLRCNSHAMLDISLARSFATKATCNSPSSLLCSHFSVVCDPLKAG